MHYDALNPKLRNTCLRARLSNRNTMYSFRRTGLSETMRAHGNAETKRSSLDTTWILMCYNKDDVGDIDIQGWAFGITQKPRSDTSREMRQRHNNVYRAQNDSYHDNLKAECHARVKY